MWSLEGIPHIMVPVQSTLTPVWNFNQHSHAQDLKVVTEPQSTYATYIPALNRAGWYKFFFLEMNAGSDDLGKLLSALCADTYKPGVLNHPDLNRRDEGSRDPSCGDSAGLRRSAGGLAERTGSARYVECVASTTQSVSAERGAAWQWRRHGHVDARDSDGV
jgi:hypothetical protein